MGAVAVDSDGLVFQGLHDKVGDDATIIGMHAGAIGVEDASDFNGHAKLAVKVKKERFGAALPFVVARANADWVDVAPIRFLLGMLMRIAVNFTGRSLQDARAFDFGELEHVDRSVNIRLDRLDGIVLVMNGRSRTCKIVNEIDIEIDRVADIVFDELERGMVEKQGNIFFVPGEEIIEAENRMPLLQQFFAQMGA